MQHPDPDLILIPPQSYPLHPWRKGRRKKDYYAISPADGELPAQRWPIHFTVWYVRSDVPVLTLLLITVLLVIFFAVATQVISNPNILVQNLGRYGLNSTSVLLKQEYHRLLTFSLFHFDIFHLMSNLVGLLLMGMRLEPPFGRLRLGLLFFFSTLFSSLIWIIFSRNSFNVSIGASGMVYALMGAALMHIIVNRGVLGKEYPKHRRNLMLIVLMLVVLDIYANAQNPTVRVDVLIHGLGFFTGLFIAWFIAPRMSVTILGLYGVTVQAAVDDENPLAWRPMQIFGVLTSIGFVILMVIQRQRWPSIFG